MKPESVPTVPRPVVRKSEEPCVEFLPGLFRTTLSYHDASMLCHFTMKKGAEVPLHRHIAIQNGYVISGRLEFFRSDGSSCIVGPGDGYCFDSNETHGSKAHEDSEFIEFFSPLRTEYIVERE